jgi:SAM-dependent methyltransferase
VREPEYREAMNPDESAAHPPRLARSVGQGIFGQDAAGYDSARLGYPEDVYDRVFARAGSLPGCAVLEVGAGTGLATRDLLARGPARLLAVEPDPHMAEFLRGALAATEPHLSIVNQPFESVELEPGSFDLAVAAASFHWLEPVSALARIRTALRPGGIVALWWNVYRVPGIGDPFADEVVPMLEGIALPPSQGESTHESLNEAWYRGLLESNRFEGIEYMLFRRERTLDPGAVRALYSTYSFVRQLDSSDRRHLLDRIVDLAESAFGGRVPNVVLTPLYIAARG